MKTKNLLTRISFGALFAAAALLPAALTSCSSESDPTPTPEPEPIPEGMARINMSFAAPAMTTRADENTVSDAEGKINSLWVYFFKQGANSTSELKYGFVIPVSGNNTTDATTNATLHKIDKVTTTAQDMISGMNVEPATYHIYVLANMPNDCSSLEPTSSNLSSITETAVSTASFSTSNGTFTLSDGLPMATDCTELASVSNATFTKASGDLKIESGSVSLVTPLTILCSKVRYTLFFDNTDSSSISYPYTSFSLTSTTLKNAHTKTTLFSTAAKTTQTTQATLTLTAPGRKDYPQGDLSETWFKQADNVFQADLTGNGSGSNQYVYQDYIYINEDPTTTVTSTTDPVKTTIDFATTLGVAGATGATENKTFTVVLPNKTAATGAANTLTKGVFYDVVGKITGAGFEVMVAVKPWSTADTDSFDF